MTQKTQQVEHEHEENNSALRYLLNELAGLPHCMAIPREQFHSAMPKGTVQAVLNLHTGHLAFLVGKEELTSIFKLKGIEVLHAEVTIHSARLPDGGNNDLDAKIWISKAGLQQLVATWRAQAKSMGMFPGHPLVSASAE